MADRKRILKWALTVATLAGLAGLVIVFLQFRNRQGPPLPIPKSAGKALMTLAQVHQYATKEGKLQWELDAESAQLQPGGQQMILKAPKVDFIMGDGSIIHLTAQNGTLDTQSNDMSVSGNVMLRNSRYTLKTETLVYRHTARTLSSAVPVDITSGRFDLRANSMLYKIDENLAQFDGQVEGWLYDDLAL
ncbi:MAG: LPS export ABC transporter periplasmic protein LptC [Desulfatitalea sp.]|nr:LPS export ABC transporter periplasmic protein LptC [Desulfatitalea sp.]NNJ99422.1 LPS export ABC transporter periplasmic protein LptC [Desulfatitalea sp.]